MIELEVGRVVLSTAGRDKGNFFIVLEIVDDKYVKIVDGNIRKLSNPKLKKIKHLKATEIMLEKIATKIIEQKQIFDAEIKGALRALNA